MRLSNRARMGYNGNSLISDWWKEGSRMHKLLIVGAGRGGTALLRLLSNMEEMTIIAVVDERSDAPGLELARSLGIEVGTDFRPYLSRDVDVILEATGNQAAYEEILRLKQEKTALIPGTFTSIIMKLISEKEALIAALTQNQRERETMLNSTHDAIIAVNRQGIITLFNRAAERLMGLEAADVLGTVASEKIPNTRLHIVLETGQPELNQEQVLPNKTRIITNRVPVRNEQGEVVGAVAIFRDITEIMTLAEEVTDLKELKSMLQAIIHSSDEAISVVDAKGNGLLINPAYTRLTGLQPEDIIGKPATVDISEGDSMHMRVLKTKKPVRGVHMKVGPKRKDVVVNVAPVMVDGELKGSVGVIHDVSEIKRLTEELERAHQIIRTLEAKYTFADIIGFSEPMRAAIEQAQKAALTRATVLLRGESGTGKELFAHAIHNASERKYKQFIRVNCAAISEHLLESELFGYEEGAFTGARRGGKRGLFEEASGGTIFLDEIGELSMSMQVKLLRVLQEREVVRVGGTKAIDVDVRVIAATHVNLESAIQAGRFREDLYYRLLVVPIYIPPLRQRLEDIQPLAMHLLRKYNQEYGRNVEEIAPETLRILLSYHWPGNVRELENVLARAMIHMRISERVILPEHLPPLERKSGNHGGQRQETAATTGKTLKEAVEEAERQHIIHELTAARGNRTLAAKRLGISIRSLYYKLEKLGITEEQS
jgi:PAS domain S-box-containing protein